MESWLVSHMTLCFFEGNIKKLGDVGKGEGAGVGRAKKGRGRGGQRREECL